MWWFFRKATEQRLKKQSKPLNLQMFLQFYQTNCNRSLLSMSLNLEQKSRDESEYLKRNWNEGPFNFLLTRTIEKYSLKANTARRLQCERLLGSALPQLTDEMLLSLYVFACRKYQQRCRNQYGATSGFCTTRSESDFSETLQSIIKKHPKLNHLEIYPNNSQSRDLQTNFKMVIGNYVPDFLVFGIKGKGSSAVAIEIDGDSHLDKYSKDELRFQHLKELKIFTWEIPNAQAKDTKFIERALLDMYRLRNGSLNQQIQRVKRMIWIKTIVCQLSLKEIEKYIYQQFLMDLHLEDEATLLVKSDKCPRSIKKELKKLLLR